MDYAPALYDAMDTLRKREIAQKAPFKARAYQIILQQLKAHPTPITCYEDIAHFHGMGEKIREKVREIFETGRLKTAERAKEVYSLDALDTLQHIYGIGPAKAVSLVEQEITTVEHLRIAVQKIPSLLNDKQQIGLRYYEDLLLRIPREEMLQHEVLLKENCPLEAELVGSFRRQAPTSGDIDVLLRVPSMSEPLSQEKTKQAFYRYVQRLQKTGYIEEILALGEHKCMAICRLPNQPARRLDLLVTPDEEYACALFYFTGSDRFNVAVRQHALSRGYTLNEHRLALLPSESASVSSASASASVSASTKPHVPYFATEQELFRFLYLEYTEPIHRVDASSLRMRKRPVLYRGTSRSQSGSPPVPPL